MDGASNWHSTRSWNGPDSRIFQIESDHTFQLIFKSPDRQRVPFKNKFRRAAVTRSRSRDGIPSPTPFAMDRLIGIERPDAKATINSVVIAQRQRFPVQERLLDLYEFFFK